MRERRNPLMGIAIISENFYKSCGTKQNGASSTSLKGTALGCNRPIVSVNYPQRVKKKKHRVKINNGFSDNRTIVTNVAINFS